MGSTIVFPGDGTTAGMNSGIFLQASQKLWGSGISYSIATTEGVINVPAQSSTSPVITNTNIDTEGNAITLATNNAISGIIITSAMNDAIYGSDPQSLEVSSCLIENTNTYAIETSFSDQATISLSNNQFLNNVNGVLLTLNGTSAIVCSGNTFEGQSSPSSVPFEIVAENSSFTAFIENNVFNDNIVGGVRCNLVNVSDADMSILNNTITNNQTGSLASLGSSVVIISDGIVDHCSISLMDNTFSGNSSNALYMHTSGTITDLEVTASTNIMSDNGGSAIVLATPSSTLKFTAIDNTITEINDNAIAVISSILTENGNIKINNNTIVGVGNASNGIAINQDFSVLDLSLLNNEIDGCEGTGIISYAPTGIDFLTLNISGNIISNCQNLASNAAPGIDMEQYTNFEGFITSNTLSENLGTAVFIGSTLPNVSACLTLMGNNSSSDYLLISPVGGLFNLSPCNVDTANIGIINTSGTITPVQSCPDAIDCPL